MSPQESWNRERQKKKAHIYVKRPIREGKNGGLIKARGFSESLWSCQKLFIFPWESRGIISVEIGTSPWGDCLKSLRGHPFSYYPLFMHGHQIFSSLSCYLYFLFRKEGGEGDYIETSYMVILLWIYVSDHESRWVDKIKSKLYTWILWNGITRDQILLSQEHPLVLWLNANLRTGFSKAEILRKTVYVWFIKHEDISFQMHTWALNLMWIRTTMSFLKTFEDKMSNILIKYYKIFVLV